MKVKKEEICKGQEDGTEICNGAPRGDEASGVSDVIYMAITSMAMAMETLRVSRCLLLPNSRLFFQEASIR
ncbi:hypothetical protein V6Z11_D02G017200 [Gossypium hirsutum]